MTDPMYRQGAQPVVERPSMSPPAPRLGCALLIVLPVVFLLVAVACNGQLPPPTAGAGPAPAGTTATPARSPATEETEIDESHAPLSTKYGGEAEDNGVEFERISLEQGLSQSVVSCILQDSKGFMWFGTQDGLNRYDGYEFVVYTHDPENVDTLGSSYIQSLSEDASGALWIATNGGGISSLDRQTGHFTHYQHDPDDVHSLSNNAVQTLYQDQQGVLWIGTNGGGLDRYDSQAGWFVHYQNDPSDPQSLSDDHVHSIYEDREGTLWVGTEGAGLNRLDRETGRFVRYQHDPEDPHGLSNDAVHAIYEDREGVLWVGTYGGGLDRLDRETGQFTHYRNDPNDPYSLSNNQVCSIYEDQAGVLWIGTFGGGLERLDRETGRFVHYQNDPADPYSLSSNDVWPIYEDQTGVLWIGTFGGGVNRLDREGSKFRHYQADPDNPRSLSGSMVWAIYEDGEGILWIGTNGAGLNRLDRQSTAASGTEQFIHYRHVPTDSHSLSDDVVWSIYEDRHGVLWIGTSAGLDRFDRETEQFVHYPTSPIFTIRQDRGGLLWLGTWGEGLGRFDPETEQFVFFQNDPADVHSLSDNSVLTVLEDREGVLWAGTFNGGLNRFDPEMGQFVRYQNDLDDPQSLSHNTVVAIHQDADGVLWLATGGGGLDKLDRTAMTFSHYTVKDGLPNDTVYGILEDDVPAQEGGPNLWLSTNRGLSKFNPKTETFKNYDVGDGLQSTEFNQGAYHKSRSGEMFFGGVNGFNAFYPEAVRDNTHIPPIVLTALTQGGEDVAAGTAVESLTKVRLEWPRNFFEFEFAALNYAQPEENQYAYMLEGFDADWIEAETRRFGGYTNLPGGTYTLRLKGSNNDAIWNEEGHSLEITIVPPFWQTWWFQGIVAAVLLGGAVGGYGLRVRSMQARRRELEIQVADRTKELAALNAVTAAVSQSLDLQKILDDALATILQVTGTEGGGVYLLDKKAGVLAIAAHRGFGPELAGQIDRLQADEGFSGHVLQSGQPLLVEDVSADQRLTRMAVRDEGYHSLACVPLRSKGETVGTLFAVSRSFRGFTDRDVQLLSSISDQIGVAIDNVRLYEDARTRLAQLTALQATTRAVASTLDLKRLLNLIIEEATTLLQADGGFINLVDWEAHEDEVVAASSAAVGILGHRSSLESSLSGWVAVHNEPLISSQVHTDLRARQPALSCVEAIEMQSAALVPLTIKNQVVGTLVIIGTREGKKEFSPPDLDLLVSFANQAATAIENAQLLEAQRQRADELDALRTTMTEVTAELKLPALLQAIVERAAGLLDATGGELALYDEASQELRVVVSYNLGEDHVGTLHKLGEGAMGRVAQSGEPMILPDYRAWEGGLKEYSHVRATLAVPLKVGSRLVGVFTTVTTDPARRFTDADLHLLNLFAQQAAIAIENARLYEQAQRLAVVEERQRLARDLHDSVTQALYGMTLYSEAAMEELSLGRLGLVTEYLRELQDTGRQAMAEMRLLIHELRPPVLTEEGLVGALQARLLAVEGRAGLETEFKAELEARLPIKVEEGLYRIAREALNNALKHAQASHITVRLYHTTQDGKVALEILDDGVGFDPIAAREGGGLGLSAMEGRAAELGGRLTVETGPQGGTRVFAEVST